jgi:hypothetical protein
MALFVILTKWNETHWENKGRKMKTEMKKSLKNGFQTRGGTAFANEFAVAKISISET